MKASIFFFPNQAKKDQKTGTVPMYLRVIYQRQKSECRLNTSLTENDLLKWDPMTMRLQERNSAINHYLSAFEARFQEFLFLHPTLNNETATTIKNYILGIKTEKKKVLLSDFVNKYFERAVLNNVNRASGTIKNYRRAINHLTQYLSINKLQGLTIEDTNFEFASSFKHYLVTSDPINNRVGMTEVSASTVIKKFRTILSEAVEQGLITQNAFKRVKIKTKSPRRERLTPEQVGKIINLDLQPWPYLPIYRDIFLFSVFTGLAYHDAMTLNWQNLQERTDGNIKLTLSRAKTEVITECFLPEFVIAIARKYKSSRELEPMGKVLPMRSNKEINEQLKKLAQLAGISFRLSTHIARHTFRQLLAEASIADMGVIKRLMGQSRNGDVDEVYYSVTEKGLLLAKEKIEQLITQICND